MIVVFPTFEKDVAQLHNLLAFIFDTGGAKKHIALLVADRATPFATCVKAKQLAAQSFSEVKCISNAASVKGWPAGPNSLFFAAAHYVQGVLQEPWLFMEPDAVPVKLGWLDALEAEYKGLDTFMGDLYQGHSSETGLPVRALSGVAVYPPNAASMLKDMQAQPWDMANRELMLEKGVATPLIKHFYGKKDLPPTFVTDKAPDAAVNVLTLDFIPSQAVLFHRNKDGTLIDVLRKRLGLSSKPPNVLYAKPKAVVAQVGRSEHTIRVRRRMALGDCIAATFIADSLAGKGYAVEFQADTYCHTPLFKCPSISRVTLPKENPHVNLDWSYEASPGKHFAQAFHLKAVQQLMPLGITLPPCANFAPHLVHAAPESVRVEFTKYPKPWIAVSPRSNGFPTRTVPDDVWAKVSEMVKGTCFWLGNHGPAPKPIVDLQCKKIEQVMDGIAACDFFVGVDSGPMHIAAALGKPGIAIRQASNPELHLSDQRDFSKFDAPVDCLDCNGQKCRLGGAPKCQQIDPYILSAAINYRLVMFDEIRVDAVVCVYKPDPNKLARCLDSLSSQVSNIIISGDQATAMRSMSLPDNSRFVRSWQSDIGYGRKANYGMRYTGAPWIMLVNDDVYLEPDAVKRLLALAQKHERVGIVGHMLRYPDGTIQHGGTGRTKDGKGWMHLDYKRANSRFTSPVEIENVTGASVLVRREAFYQSMGFDERFYLYCEDNDLCMKMRQNGWRVLYDPTTSGVHEESQSTRQTPRIQQIMQESVKYFHSKWDHLLKQPVQLPMPV